MTTDDGRLTESEMIRGKAHLLGDDINTDLHCSSKYHPGRDNAYVAQRAFERVSPGFAPRFTRGGIIVAGKNFGNNSSREQAVHILRLMGVAGVVSTAFGRQFYRNCINNGLPGVECDLAGIAEGDEVEIDLAAGRVAVPARGIVREVPPLPPAMQAILAAGGLIPFLKAHPNWQVA
ncbi:MAG TPA: 3-isopropylmalate dehydratase [Vicinamibacterales bacterium]|nr:3-isopropylmalate dehydratase [Vicinamibacterales bacterium]